MTREYFVSNETAYHNGTATEADRFTNKKDARKCIKDRKRSGDHFACYIYEDGTRIDNGCIDAQNKIQGVG